MAIAHTMINQFLGCMRSGGTMIFVQDGVSVSPLFIVGSAEPRLNAYSACENLFGSFAASWVLQC